MSIFDDTLSGRFKTALEETENEDNTNIIDYEA